MKFLIDDGKIKYRLARNLEELRKRKNLRQADVAHIIGVSKNGYALYEQCVHLPSAKVLAKICNLFEVDIADLFRY